MNDQFFGYKLSRAKRYLKRAKQILIELDLMNSKVDSDFFALDSYCQYHQMKLKGGNDEHRDHSNT